MKEFDYKLLYYEHLEKIKNLESDNKLLSSRLNFLIDKYSISIENIDKEIRKQALKDEYNNINYNEILVTKSSSLSEKINLYLSLFQGREDVCAVRWESSNTGKSGYSPFCKNEWKYGLCGKGKGVKCFDCNNQDFYKLDFDTLKMHFLGKKVLGIYPINQHNLCKFIVIDLDGNNWRNEAEIILNTFTKYNISAYLERSRSGNGAHIWLFFEDWVEASKARKLIFIILDKAMESSSVITFKSYDRLLPNQDLVSKNGFGNLIALPLQREAAFLGNTLFLNDDYLPYEDQWLFFQSVKKLNRDFIESFINEHGKGNPFSNDNYDGYKVSENDFTETLELQLARGVIISKSGLSSKGIVFLRRLASYHNPEFYSKQAMGMSTFKTPKVISVYEENEDVIILPKALFDKLKQIFDELKVKYIVSFQESSGKFIDVEFNGHLSEEQEIASRNILSNTNGVLCAVPGFGKTVVASYVISMLKCSTIIMVHTKELAIQWIDRLLNFLDINYEAVQIGKRRKEIFIGKYGAGENKLTGKIDVVIMQSLFEKDKSIKDFVDDYGLVIVDECHHVPSKFFRLIMQRIQSKYIYGLTATPIRKDGHHPIINMYCGDIRYKKTIKDIKKDSTYSKILVPRFTPCRSPIHFENKNNIFQQINTYICEDDFRNNMIADDVLLLLKQKRKILILTDRVSHLIQLESLLKEKCDAIILHGRLKSKERKSTLKKINAFENTHNSVLIATGKLIGEGFDLPCLDTLILASPISWKGRILQYAGRIHRNYEGKTEVKIIDYVDVHIKVLERMYFKRLKVYHSMGYSIIHESPNLEAGDRVFFHNEYLDVMLNDINNCSKSLVISSSFIKKMKYRDYIEKIFIEIEKNGINIIKVKNNEYNFMIIDDKLVWLGDRRTVVIRSFSYELVNELNAVFHSKYNANDL